MPSVVTLTIRKASSGSSGSGEILRSDGYILTNDHVISGAVGGGTIDVLFSDGQTKRANIVGRVTRLDLAVLKVEPANQLPTISVGHSDALLVGQPVVALGAPLGLNGTVTSGIVSALGRDVPVPAANGSNAILPGAIQTDAAINPGNSGGALVDCAGHLIGVNTAIATVPNAAGTAGGGSVGIGFAIPVDLAMVVADDLIAHGRFTPPTLGMSTTSIPQAVAQRYHSSEGLFIQQVTAGGPADTAGLKPGDVITHADGKATTGPESLLVLTLTKRAGDNVRIDYERGGQSHTATLKLAQQP